jgi:hypothetical protein
MYLEAADSEIITVRIAPVSVHCVQVVKHERLPQLVSMAALVDIEVKRFIH